MAKKKRKSKKSEDFKKVHLKVGKVLKKQNVTDTRIATKKITLLEQIPENVTTQALDLNTICSQCGNHNANVRKNALHRLKQTLTQDPALIGAHLAVIVRTCGRVCCSVDAVNEQTQRNTFHSILSCVCTNVSETSLWPHFNVLLAHLSCALTHHHESVRQFAMMVLQMMVDTYPNLCSSSDQLNTMLLNAVSECVQSSQTVTFARRRNVFELMERYALVLLNEAANGQWRTDHEHDRSQSSDHKLQLNFCDLSDISGVPSLLIDNSTVPNEQAPFDVCIFSNQSALDAGRSSGQSATLLHRCGHMYAFCQVLLPFTQQLWSELCMSDNESGATTACKKAKTGKKKHKGITSETNIGGNKLSTSERNGLKDRIAKLVSIVLEHATRAVHNATGGMAEAQKLTSYLSFTLSSTQFLRTFFGADLSTTIQMRRKGNSGNKSRANPTGSNNAVRSTFDFLNSPETACGTQHDRGRTTVNRKFGNAHLDQLAEALSPYCSI